MKDKTKKELRRQIVHASGIALVPLTLVFGKFSVAAAGLIMAFVILLLAEHRNSNMESHYGTNRKKRIAVKSAQYQMNSATKKRALASVSSNSFLNVIHIAFERFERSGGNYRGAFCFYLASAVSLFLFSQRIALLSITVLALGDSFSTAVGIFGKRKIFYNRKKTWEGTSAGFAAAFIGCFLINPYLALPAAIAGMFVESLPLKIDDNLTVPILTGVVLSAIVAL